MNTRVDVGHARQDRVVFLDLARCLAIVMMVMAHFTDSFLDPGEVATPLARLYGNIRGLTAPLFFLVSGWAFAVATLPRWATFRSLSPELAARARRAGVLYLWGYLLTLPWWAEGFPFEATDQVWEAFFAFGVLQCIATAFVFAHVLVRLAPSPRVFSWLALVFALALVLVAPPLQRWGMGLSRPIGGAFYAGAVEGGFPLAPWAAFFLLGAAAGTITWVGRWSLRRLAACTAGAGAVMLLLARVVDPLSRAWEQTGPRGATSISLFLYRLGVTSLMLAALAVLTSRIHRLPGPTRVLARHALTFYVSHMLVLWGTPLVPGLFHVLPHTLTLVECALLALLCIAATYAAIHFWKLARSRLPLLRMRPSTEPIGS